MTTEVINTNNYRDCINCKPPHREAAKKLFIAGQSDILIGPNQMTFSWCIVFSSVFPKLLPTPTTLFLWNKKENQQLQH